MKTWFCFAAGLACVAFLSLTGCGSHESEYDYYPPSYYDREPLPGDAYQEWWDHGYKETPTQILPEPEGNYPGFNRTTEPDYPGF